MSIFDIKKSKAWNYNDPEKGNYCTTLTGVVVGMDNPQARDFQTKKLRVWEDGTPVRNVRLFVKPNGTDDEVSVTFRPGSALFEAFGKAGVGSITDTIGHVVTLTTREGTYGFANPRPWDVLVGEEVQGVTLHKIPVLDYDTMEPVTGQPK